MARGGRPAGWGRVRRGAGLAILLAGGAAGCSSPMMISTQPANAVILVDGREIGRSPVLYGGTNGLDGGVEVRARLEGYTEAVRMVPRQPSWYHLGESVLFPPAALWGWYLPDGVTLFLEPAAGAAPGPPGGLPK